MAKPLLFILLVAVVTGLHAAPSKDLWPYWQKHNNRSQQTISHAAWTRFLRKYVHTTKVGLNLVAYAQVPATDRKKLQTYIRTLEDIKISHYNRAQQEAYWINLYNAETVNVILEHYPVKSILDINISPGWFSRGPWDAKLLTIEGNKVSLNDIEHRILRPIWDDNRLHYALNCASIGCPNLQRHAFTADKLNNMLNQAAVTYINSPRGAHFNGDKLIVSKIYDWYQVDFGDSEQGVIKHLMRYAKPALKQKLASTKGIADYEYDWNLNQWTQ